MKNCLLISLGLSAACLILVACASNKPAEKKSATPPTEVPCWCDDFDWTPCLENQVTVFQNSTEKITKHGLKRMSLKTGCRLLKRRGDATGQRIRLNTLKAMVPRPTQVLSKSLRSVVIWLVRFRTIVEGCQLREMDATVTLLHVLLVPEPKSCCSYLMSLYDNDIDAETMESLITTMWKREKAKDPTTKFLYGENFNGDLTQFKGHW